MSKPKKPTPASIIREIEADRGELMPMAKHVVRWCLVWLLANYELVRKGEVKK